MWVRWLVVMACVCNGWSARGEQSFKVATYNIRYASPNDGRDIWSNRVDRVAKVIAENDIVGLQEVTLAQLDALRERLTDFDWYGVGRDDGKSGGEHAVIFFRKDRFEAIDRGTIWLSPTPDQVGVKGWDAALPRTCTWMILRDLVGDRPVWFANTHFDHRGSLARTESAKLLRQFAAKESGSLPVILLGDFNCLPGSDPYRALTSTSADANTALRDARNVSMTPPAGPASTWNGFREIAPGRLIDHIFVNERVTVRSLTTLDPKTAAGRFASDHLPVRIVAEIDGGEAASQRR